MTGTRASENELGHAIGEGAIAAVRRRTAAGPLSFAFTWRGKRFTGAIADAPDGLSVTLRGELGGLPFSAENKATRRSLLALIEASRDGANRLSVVNGTGVVLETTLAVGASPASTAGDLITALTVAVLSTAPYLDLLAERFPDPAAAAD